MKQLRRAVCIMAFGALPTHALAFAQTSGELVHLCTERREICRTYIEGVVDTLNTLAGWGYLKSNLVCVPKNVDSQQVADIVSKYLFDNPDLNTATANKSVLDILSWTFPCESTSSIE